MKKDTYINVIILGRAMHTRTRCSEDGEVV